MQHLDIFTNLEDNLFVMNIFKPQLGLSSGWAKIDKVWLWVHTQHT